MEGTIGSAKVTFKLGKIKPYQIQQLQPDGFKFEGDTLVWERKDFEPDYDLWLYPGEHLYAKIG